MKDTLVFGASLKPNRYSNIAINRLAEKGIATKAYGLQVGITHGVEISTNLDDIQNIHTITLYLNPKRQGINDHSRFLCHSAGVCHQTPKVAHIGRTMGTGKYVGVSIH